MSCSLLGATVKAGADRAAGAGGGGGCSLLGATVTVDADRAAGGGGGGSLLGATVKADADRPAGASTWDTTVTVTGSPGGGGGGHRRPSSVLRSVLDGRRMHDVCRLAIYFDHIDLLGWSRH